MARRLNWINNEARIRRAMENGAETLHEIYVETGLTYRTIRKHLNASMEDNS